MDSTTSAFRGVPPNIALIGGNIVSTPQLNLGEIGPPPKWQSLVLGKFPKLLGGMAKLGGS